jgi:hypothetical protein
MALKKYLSCDFLEKASFKIHMFSSVQLLFEYKNICISESILNLFWVGTIFMLNWI